jgi:hypothetical protein
VLCYALCPHTGELYFLLGKEAVLTQPGSYETPPSQSSSPPPPSSSSSSATSTTTSGPVHARRGWCNFGGRIEEGESEEEAAAREFYEETLCCVCTEGCARFLPPARRPPPPPQHQDPNPSPNPSPNPHPDAHPHAHGLSTPSDRNAVGSDGGARQPCTRWVVDPCAVKAGSRPAIAAGGCDPVAQRIFGIPPPPCLCSDERPDHQRPQRERKPAPAIGDAHPQQPRSGAHIHPASISDDMAASLRRGAHCFAVTTCLNHGASPEMPRRYHITFVKRVPWDPGVVADFAEARRVFSAISTSANVVRALLRICPERSSLVSERMSAPAGVGAQAIGEGYPHDAEAISASRMWESGYLGRALDRACDGLREAMREVPQWLAGHPAVRADDLGLPLVRNEFLEKEAIAWWSAERLREMLRSGGCYRRECLRASFLPTLAVAMDVLEARGPRAGVEGYTVYCMPRWV